MSKSCVIYPQVRNKEGQLEDSRLFKDLLSITGENRKLSKDIYLKTKNLEFKSSYKGQLNEQGEPTIMGLNRESKLGELIDNSEIINNLQKKLPKDMDNTPQNIREMSNQISNFNNQPIGKEYLAIIGVTPKGQLTSSVGKTSPQRIQVAKQIKDNNTLNSKLTDILKEWGIGVGVLNTLDQINSINGVVDFHSQEKTAEGLIEMIRLADSQEGLESLPEEFSHIVVEMMRDNPLVQRLIQNLAQNDRYKSVLGEQYQKYTEIYGNNTDALIAEAAGKMLSAELIKSHQTQEEGYSGIGAQLISRVVRAIKQFFSKFDASLLRKAIIESDSDVSELAKRLLNNKIDVSELSAPVSESPSFYQIKDENAHTKKLLADMQDNNLKRINLYIKQNPDSPFIESATVLQNDLVQAYEDTKYLDGVSQYIEYSLDNIKKVDMRLTAIQNKPGMEINERAKVLRDANNFIKSFDAIIDSFGKAKIKDPNFFQSEEALVKKVNENFEAVIGKTRELNSRYLNLSKGLLEEFLRLYVNEEVLINKGKHEGQYKSLEEIIDEAPHDISLWDRYLDSMADTKDYLLTSIFKVFNDQVEKSRVKTIRDINSIKALGIELERAGVKNTKWMTETLEDGTPGYNYISEYNWSQYNINKGKFFKDLNLKDIGAKEKAKLIKAFHKEHSQTFPDGSIGPNNNYVNRDFLDMMEGNTHEDQAKRDYYTKIMEMKESLEDQMPEKLQKLNRRIFIRKDKIERLKGVSSADELRKTAGGMIADNFLDRSDETDTKEKNVFFDFSERRVYSLPIFYISKSKDEKIETYSEDVTGAMIVYADMANRYGQMKEILDILEISRDVLKTRDIVQDEDGKSLIESVGKGMFKLIKPFTKKGENSNIYDKYSDFMDMQVYQKTRNDSGHIGRISLNKMASSLMFLTSLKALGVNLLQGSANLINGLSQGTIEAIGGRHYSVKDLFKADLIYSKHLPGLLSNLGNRQKNDKLSLWNQRFNVTQDHESRVISNDFHKKTWLGRLANTSSFFLFSSMGEHFLSLRTSLALSETTKVLLDGEESSLFNAMEIEYFDENDKSLGGNLVVKEGATTLDGSPISERFLRDFGNKSKKINRNLNGTYNEVDKAAAHKYVMGRLVLMFRKWMADYWNNRYGKKYFSHELDDDIEGYYRTSFGFLKDIYKEMKDGKFDLITQYQNLDDYSKTNVRKSLADMALLFIIRALIMGLFSDDDRDRSTESYGNIFFEYQTRRALTEIGGFSPLQVGQQGLDLISSPSATFSTVEKLWDLSVALNPYNYTSILGDGNNEIIKSGRYKGKSKAQRAWLRSPFVPIYDNIIKAADPRDAMKFFM